MRLSTSPKYPVKPAVSRDGGLSPAASSRTARSFVRLVQPACHRWPTARRWTVRGLAVSNPGRNGARRDYLGNHWFGYPFLGHADRGPSNGQLPPTRPRFATGPRACTIPSRSNSCGTRRSKRSPQPLPPVNQRGCSRFSSTPFLPAWTLYRFVQRQLAKHICSLDAIAICPHAPDDGCACRKPRTGMMQQIEKQLREPIAYQRSWTIVDGRCWYGLLSSSRFGYNPTCDIP